MAIPSSEQPHVSGKPWFGAGLRTPSSGWFGAGLRTPSSGGGCSPALWLWLCAVLFALARWWPLVRGGGLIGGDIYTYYFPLKAWYADRLHAGELPLWNPLIGNGMPALGESQTGVLYPFNVVLYSLLPLNAAFNASMIAHYMLAFGFTGMYLRRLGLGLAGVLLGATVFTYGWFPARVSLEWAIVSGAWMPIAFWSADRWLERADRWSWLVLVAALAMQLLAGHFHMAFITGVGLAVYVPLRVITLPLNRRAPFRRSLLLVLAPAVAASIAAAQLLPSLELKGRSQRALPAFQTHGLSYGKLPAWYLTQVLVPWEFYPGVATQDPGLGAEFTNPVEAHLYVGLVPLILAVASLLARPWPRCIGPNLALVAIGVVLATGWWTNLLGWLPGFGYFTGPGRYGVLAQFGLAALAGLGVERLLPARPAPRGFMAAAALLAAWADLAWATDAVASYNTRVVRIPPVSLRDRSPLAARLGPVDRVIARSANSMTLCGTAALPVYLGIGPAPYFARASGLPAEFRWDRPMSAEVAEELRRDGVTHIAAMEPHPDWPVELQWVGGDPMMNAILDRAPDQPLWLYRLQGAPGRTYLVPFNQAGTAGARRMMTRVAAEVVEEANRVQVQAQLDVAGTLVLTDLWYPGWRVEVDGSPAHVQVWESMYRAVALGPGTHTVVWKYRPASFLEGIAASGVSLAIVVLLLLLGTRRVRVAPVRREAA